MKTVSIREQGVSCDFHVYTFGSGKPHIFFTAGIHGNEVTGVWAAEKLVHLLSENPPVNGRISVIPTVNRPGMRCMRRCNPYDEVDLNRVFPGDPKGSIADRLADAVYRETEDADVLVDLHCCGQHGMPYILSVYSESEKVKDLVLRIPMPIAVHSEGTGGQLFTESMRRRGQAACIIELPSGPSAGAVNTAAGELCFQALLSMLRSYGLLPGDPASCTPALYNSLQDIEAPKAGLFEPCRKKGDFVEEGEAIGTVLGQPVLMPRSGLLMSILPCTYLMPEDLWVGMYVVPWEGQSEA